MTAEINQRAPVLFIPHGGGPMPLLGDPSHQPLVDFLRDIPAAFAEPEAILVISAHWEAEKPTLLGDAHPQLYYDYYGFPEESYRLEYPAPNPPHWRTHVARELERAGLEVAFDDRRGYDHGVFVPLLLMYPEARLPVLQLSLLQGLDPQTHLELGRALGRLREAGVMILGSGLSFHNMGVLVGGRRDDGAGSDAFHDWLATTLADTRLSAAERVARLARWREAPFARHCHPREEHLLPLHVCVGAAAGDPAEIVFDQPLFGQRTLGALWR